MRGTSSEVGSPGKRLKATMAVLNKRRREMMTMRRTRKGRKWEKGVKREILSTKEASETLTRGARRRISNL